MISVHILHTLVVVHGTSTKLCKIRTNSRLTFPRPRTSQSHFCLGDSRPTLHPTDPDPARRPAHGVAGATRRRPADAAVAAAVVRPAAVAVASVADVAIATAAVPSSLTLHRHQRWRCAIIADVTALAVAAPSGRHGRSPLFLLIN